MEENKNNNSISNNANNNDKGNKMIPVEINKHPSLGRFIKNKLTVAAVSWTNQGFEKLSDEETKIVASIINTALIKYNEKMGHPLSEADIKKIQERFNEFDVYTFEDDSERYKKRYAKQEKKLGHKLAGIDTKGFIFSPTSILMLKKDEWEKYKKGENFVYFTKVVTHEGFHFLTNTKHNNMSKMGEKLTSEGADESFITKAFFNGEFSKVINDPQGNGLIHYNFNSESNYGPLVSVLNMLGEMVGVNPEVSALKGDGEFVKAVKQKYGHSFYRRILKTTDKLADPEEFNKLEHAPRYCKIVQNYVLKAINDDIIENVKNPEDAIRRLQDLQRAEEWSMRILMAEKDPKTGKFVRFETDRSFANYYRFTYTRVIEKLKERGFTDVEQKLEQCKYKPVQFKPLVRVDLENTQFGKVKFKNRIRNEILFFKNYYGIQDPARFISKEELQLYNQIVERQKKTITERKPHIADRMGFRPGPPGAKIAHKENPAPQRPAQSQAQPQKNPPQAKITPIPRKPKGRGDDDDIKFGDF